MPSGNILITWLVLRNITITCQKLSNILNKFQMFLKTSHVIKMFPLGIWQKHFENIVGQISNDCQLLWVVTYEAHVEVTIQMLQKCSHQSQIEHMLWVHFKCLLYVITMKLLGSFNQSSQCSQHVITGSRPPHPQWM